jgi:hypothetical protein
MSPYTIKMTPPTGWTAGVRFHAGQTFFCSPRVHTGCGTHPVSYPLGGNSPWVKRAEQEADDSHSSSAVILNAWKFAFTPAILLQVLTLSHRGDPELQTEYLPRELSLQVT